jgi:hypothetical protein
MARLYSLIEALRARCGSALLLDLGGHCRADVWHCAVTEGRSALLALDGMGYHAANAADLTEAARQKLLGLITMGLVSEQRAWRYHVPPVVDEGIVVSLAPVPALRLNIVLSPSDQTCLVDSTLRLGRVPPWTVGAAQVDLRRSPRVTHVDVHPLTDAYPPDPTISAVVELILEEAEGLRQRRR